MARRYLLVEPTPSIVIGFSYIAAICGGIYLGVEHGEANGTILDEVLLSSFFTLSFGAFVFNFIMRPYRAVQQARSS